MKISDLIKQKPYEQIEYVLRRHPITFIPYIIFFLCLLIAPFVLYTLTSQLFSAFLKGTTIILITYLSMSGYLAAILVFFFSQFVDYYLDMWIVTNDRLIDIKQSGLFSKKVTELDLFQIQDATAEVTGAFATLFDYGNVTIKTASVSQGLKIHNVADPNSIRSRIIELSNGDRKYHVSVAGIVPTSKPNN